MTPARSDKHGTAGWRSRAGAVAAAVVLAAPGLTLFAAPALAAPEPVGDCTTTSGVIVAVDFAHWGGPLLRACGSTPTTGYDLLNQGGWHTAGTEHDGPGFICRIGYSGYQDGTEYPTPQQESCVLTPPVNAYWTFWQAGPGQDTWSYSNLGATSEQPAAGSVELWVFGGTNIGGTTGSAVPAFSPDSVRALNKSQERTVRKPALKTQGTSAPAQSASPAASRSSSAAARASRAAPVTPTVRDAPPAAASAAHVSHGSATPAIVTLVIVLVLAAAGITAAARRPRRGR